MTDTTELRRLAQQATPGPWSAEPYRLRVRVDDSDAGIAVPLSLDSQQAQYDAAYIAAVNPAVVLELLDELDRLRGELKREKRLMHLQVNA